MSGDAAAAGAGGLSSDQETLALWGHFQNALEELGQDRSQIGFLDVAVFGAQSSGKSSLLSTLCGLQLPTGTGSAVTKCPIRISVTDTNESYVQLPGANRDQIPLPQNGSRPCLTEAIYSQALQQLSGGAMTPAELEIKVGRPGHLPLNIVDTPGLIINDVREKPVVDELIRTVLAGSGQADRPLLPIMTGTGQDVDINNLRTSLVRGRAFITVITHVDHLMADQVEATSAHVIYVRLILCRRRRHAHFTCYVLKKRRHEHGTQRVLVHLTAVAHWTSHEHNRLIQRQSYLGLWIGMPLSRTS